MEAIIIGIAKSAIRLATPYLYASIGETIGQLSGVLNLGVDGVMLMGAFSAFYTVLKTGNLWLGLLAAAVSPLCLSHYSLAFRLWVKSFFSKISWCMVHLPWFLLPGLY